MGNSTSLTLKANLIGVAAIVIAGAYFAYDLTHTKEEKPCFGFYPPAVSLNLKKGNGELLTPEALQGRSRSQDWGLIEKLKVERTKGAPAASVFTFNLTKDDVSSSLNKKGGASFPWRPSQLNGATSVCFAYNVWIPQGFEFAAGGILPGVASRLNLQRDETDSDDDGELVRRLRAHLTWSKAGQLGFVAFDPSAKHSNDRLVLRTKNTLVRGRWHRLEQELILNGPDKRNGKVRLWVDGDLILDEKSVVLRKTGDAKFYTALYHVSHGTPFGNGNGNVKLNKDSTIRISPMEFSWK